MNPQRLQRPDRVDEHAWDLAAELRPQECYQARRALTALDRAEYTTDLNARLTALALATLNTAERVALRHVWTLASDRGLRTRPLPSRWVRRENSLREIGIDPDTVAFMHLYGDELKPVRQVIWWYLRQLHDRGLSTKLDVDLEDGPVSAFIHEVLAQGLRGPLAEVPTTKNTQFSLFRRALRKLYGAALRHGTRSRPVPQLITYTPLTMRTPDLWSHLPSPERERLQRLFSGLNELAARQQAGRSRRISARRKDTIAQMTLRNYRVQVLNSILRHALDLGWPMTLDRLFTAERLTDWVYRGHHADGLPMSPDEPSLRRALLRGFLERAADVGQPLVPREGLEDLFGALGAYRGAVNVRSTPRDADDERFTPSLEQIHEAIALIEEQFERDTVRYASGQMSRLDYHNAFQERTLFWCELYGMWRKDTAATIDLLLAERHARTGGVLARGVRAKQARGDATHHTRVILVPALVDKIDELLRFEGRSIEHPLRPGETAVRLRAEVREVQDGMSVVVRKGDRWGNDVLKNDDETVVPLFRRHPDSPEPVTYEQMDLMQRRVLRRIGWLEAVPHSLRVTGAIYLRWRGFPLDLIMEIGLWKSLEVLLRCYVRQSFEDRLADMAALAPSARAATPTIERQRRQEAVVRIQRAALELGALPQASVLAFEHFEQRLRAAVDEIARANAAERGKEWRPATPSQIDDRELILIDEALRPLYPDGLAELLGRPVLASSRGRGRKPRVVKGDVRSDDHAKLLAKLALPSRQRGDSEGRPEVA